MSDTKDTKSRKWLLEFNNPLDKGFTHEKIKEGLSQLTSLVYYCMSDEIGLEKGTPHTHLYIACSSAVRFSTLGNIFPKVNREMARGTSQQNRDYVAKEGRWLNDKKHETSVPGTFEEYGDMPQERQGSRADLHRLHDLILSGASNVDILDENPSYMTRLTDIERVRQEYRIKKYRREFRLLDVTYICGKTGAGKSRSIMEKYGYENVYRVTNDRHPFDGYQGEDVIIFEEFRSQFMIGDMLNYLDGYPLALPCRFVDRQACFTKVFLASNWELRDQYPNVKVEQKETWLAFARRIHRVVHMTYEGRDEMTTQEYLTGWREISDDEPLPWDYCGEQQEM